MIRFESVDVDFGTHTAVRGLDLEIREGEFFTLLGPSGCGKTTALRSLAGFVAPSAGRIRIDGENVTRTPSERRGIGMVFQNYALFPSMDVRANIAFGLRVQKVGHQEERRRVDEIAERTGLTADQLGKQVSELSGGQQQRVAIARALVLTPRILLLDEPLSNLDAKLRVQLREQLKDLQSEFGITTVYVTHDQDEALALSDRIAVLDRGGLEQVGTPREIYDQSATPFVCRFVGDSNRLTAAMLRALNAGRADLDEHAESYIRPERLRLVDRSEPSSARGVALAGAVTGVSYHGGHSVLRVRVADGEVRVAVPVQTADPDIREGAQVGIGVDPAWVRQYPATARSTSPVDA